MSVIQVPDAGPLLGDPVVLDDVGPAYRGRIYPAAGTASLLLLPMAVVLGTFIAYPVWRTVRASAARSGYGAVVSAEGFWDVLIRTVLWAIAVPLVVTVVGYLLATAGRRSRRGRVATGILVAPIALPLVVTGVTFRLLYDPDPARGLGTIVLRSVARLFGGDPDTVPTWLGPKLVTVALMSAFVWAWVGLAIVVFRAALRAIPQSLVDVVLANGGTRRDVFRDAKWRPLLRRTATVVFFLTALATARTFDLILLMTPGSTVDDSAVLAVRIWQTSGGATSQPAAALGVVWLGLVGVGAAIAGALGSRQTWPAPEVDAWDKWAADEPARAPVGLRRRRPRVLRRTVPAVAALVWVIPVVGLIATSLRSTRDAATRGWWNAPLTMASYGTSIRSGLPGSLLFTFLLALSVTAVVLAFALPAAYALAWLLPPGMRLAGLPLMAAALVPVQVVAGPVNEVLAAVRLSGTAVGLGLVHVAFGLPSAVLLLRNGLADLPGPDVRRARLRGREWMVPWRLVRVARSALFAVGVLEFIQVWNDFVFGLLFAGAQGPPLGLLIFGQARQFVTTSGSLAAGCVLASIVPVILVAVAGRRLVDGLVSAAVRS